MKKKGTTILLTRVLIGALVAVSQILIGSPTAVASPTLTKFEWQRSFTSATFETARAEKRLVILDLEAVWCHWCHVMDEKTYSDPAIADLIKTRYIPVRVDQDARPDLGSLYRDYGWPATIIFSSQGEELEKLSGFVEPAEMIKILTELAADPRPRVAKEEVTFNDRTTLPEQLKLELENRYKSSLDRKVGGLTTNHKYLDADTLEYSIFLAAKGSNSAAKKDIGNEDAKAAEDFARLTLKNNLKLIDSVWGGVYQYSTHSDWDHAHFEKLTVKQATDMRLYAIAYTLWQDPEHLQAINNIWRYLQEFLLDSSGAFYVSQDADVVKGEHSAEYFQLDDAGRRKQGLPVVDKNLYANENGRVVSALAKAYAATAEEKFLAAARRAVDWLVLQRQIEGGGFKHSDNDAAGPYLSDSLYVAGGLLDLYAVTGERALLNRAESAANFIELNFRDLNGAPGYLTAKLGSGVIPPKPLLSENIFAARFLTLLAAYTGKPVYKELAGRAMRVVGSKELTKATISEPGVLIADEEFNKAPLHITVVGAKSDAAAKALFKAAISYPTVYKRTEWWDRAEGAMPNPDVQYPPLPKAAAFICTDRRCSLPIFEASQLQPMIRRLTGVSGM